MIENYTAVAVQAVVEECAPGSRDALERNLARAEATLRRLVRDYPSLRLAVFPEYFLTGHDAARPADQWIESAIAIPGPETERLGALARELSLFVAGASYEYDERWPGRLWNTGFLLGPTGELLLTSCKLSPDLDIGVSAVTVPGDVHTEYVSRYGADALFPTVATEIGMLGLVVGEDTRTHEVARALVLRGCEVLLNPAFERADEQQPARVRARRSRCAEELAWMVTAVPGRYRFPDGGELLAGGSAIYDFDAEVAAEALHAGEQWVAATIEIERQRKYRAQPFANMPAQLRTGLYTEEYAADRGMPVGTPGGRPITTREDRLNAGRAVVGLMAERGIWKLPGQSPVPPYGALLAQTRIRFIDDVRRRDEVVRENLEHSLGTIRAVVANARPKLVVFPEYWLQGAAMLRPVDDWIRVGLRIPGPETDVLCEFAARYGVYLVGAAFEYDPDWPGRFFNCGLVISPRGEIALKYRKLQCGDVGGLVPVTTPGQVLSEYVSRYGYESLWPILDTEIGRLGVMICHDGSFPELHRTLAMRGAEVICYPTGDAAASRPGRWDVGSTARAADNAFYFLHVNSGGEQTEDDAPVTHFHKGHSRLVDYTGRVVVRADGPGDVPLTGLIDIEGLRAFRSDPLRNPLVWHRQNQFASTYRDIPGVAIDCQIDRPLADLQEAIGLVQANIQRMFDRGAYQRPAGERILR